MRTAVPWRVALPSAPNLSYRGQQGTGAPEAGVAPAAGAATSVPRACQVPAAGQKQACSRNLRISRAARQRRLCALRMHEVVVLRAGALIPERSGRPNRFDDHLYDVGGSVKPCGVTRALDLGDSGGWDRTGQRAGDPGHGVSTREL